jgi:GWxTD domain-containing protein
MSALRSVHHLLRIALLPAGVLLLASSPGSGQVEVSGAALQDPNPSVFVDAVSFASLSGPESRLDVFVLVGYDALSFVKRGDLYDASYELTISVLDSLGSLVNERTWTEEIKGIPFDRSVSPSAVSLTQRSLTLAPGSYALQVMIRDRESNVIRSVTRQGRIADFATPQFMLSDILLLSRVSTQGEKQSIVPNVSPNVGLIADAFHVYLEVYNRMQVDSAAFVIGVLDKKEDEVLRLDTVLALQPGRNTRILRVPHTSLPLGDYRLVIQARRLPLSSDAPALALTSRMFIVRWQGMPRSVQDIDLAIAQLRYIAQEGEMSELEDAETPEEKQKRFLEFWKKRDPNPNTPRNERMEQFYARVEYANKNFKHYLDGWRTDMGMVYIIFGPPNNVDRHPFELGSKPYEVWSYYDLNYSFVFVDQTGFGDYRLETPLWEVWQRPRY